MVSWRRARWAAIDTVVVGYALLPVGWLVWLSFTRADARPGPGLLPRSWTWENYAALFTGGTAHFVRPLVNSVGVALIATVIAVTVGAMAGYAIARLTFPGKRFLLGAAIVVALSPQLSLVVPVFEIERRIGLVDTWPGLIGPYLTFALPLAMFLLAGFFAQLPADLEKAAKMDGATPWQAFRKVIVPLSGPGLGTTSILVFLLCWNDFVFAVSLTSTESARTVPAALLRFVASERFAAPTGMLAAAAVLITVPILVFVLAFRRRIIAGLTSGVVRG